MNSREAVVALLPDGLVEGVRDRRMLTRLGAAATRPQAASLARAARLDLLPPGALRRLKTVVDVGANEGRWSAAVLALARPDRLIAVEPSPDVLPLLRRAIGASRSVSIVGAAVGSSVGDVQFNITSHSHSASVLPPRADTMNALYGGYDITRNVVVPQTTIDEITRAIDTVCLLKLDVQGAERAAIEGGRTTLARTRWLLIETNFQSHYVGDMLFPELHSLLVELGFRLTGMSEPFIREGVALWADSLYERT